MTKTNDPGGGASPPVAGEAGGAVTLNVIVPPRHPGRWLAVVILALLALQMAQALAVNENFHWGVFWKHLFHPHVLRGVMWTLILTVAAMAVAMFVAISLVVMRDSDNPILRGLAWGWIWFFRGTPIYTQLLFWGLFAVLFPRLSLNLPFGPEIIGVETKWIVTPAMAA